MTTNAETGSTFYVDFERIKKHDGYVYFWMLFDYLKPDEYGDLSEKIYVQSDCKLFLYKYLSGSSHKEPMGEGTSVTGTPSGKWEYPPPKTALGTVLKSVCQYAR